MTLVGLLIVVGLLVVPSLLCCFVGGWFFLIGITSLGCWFFLLYLIGAEFWQWYKNPDQGDSDSP